MLEDKEDMNERRSKVKVNIFCKMLERTREEQPERLIRFMLRK